MRVVLPASTIKGVAHSELSKGYYGSSKKNLHTNRTFSLRKGGGGNTLFCFNAHIGKPQKEKYFLANQLKDKD